MEYHSDHHHHHHHHHHPSTTDADDLAAAADASIEPDYNSNIQAPHPHLSRSLSTPRRCNYCQKIMFFKTYRCKHCRYRCHKKCAGHSHSKARGCHRSLSGEEHWTKVLQANEVNSNLVVVPCHLSRSAPSTGGAANYPSPDGGVVGGAGSGSKSRHASTITTTTMTTDVSASASPKTCAKSSQSQSHHSSSSSYFHNINTTTGSASSNNHHNQQHYSHHPHHHYHYHHARSTKDSSECCSNATTTPGSPTNQHLGMAGAGGVGGRHHSAASAATMAAAAAAAMASSSASSSKDSGSTSNIFSTLYDRLCRWMQAAGVGSGRVRGGGDSSSRGGSRSRTPRTPRSLSRSSSVASNKSQDLYQLLHNLPDDHHTSGSAHCIHASLSSDDSEVGYRHGHHHRHHHTGSTCSSLTITSSSETTYSGHSDWQHATTASSNADSSFPPSAISTGYFNPTPSTPPELRRPRKSRPQFFSVGHNNTSSNNGRSGGTNGGGGLMPHSNLTFTISCPLKTKRQSVSALHEHRERSTLCATWPPTGRKTYGDDEEDPAEPELEHQLHHSELEDAVFGDPDEPKSWEQREAELRESLREFSIPFSDVEIGDILRVGRTTTIHKGKWHGDVMIHRFPNVKEAEVTRFWEEVSKLSMIRHENVALFMGACIEPPNLAVITSVRRGASLYEQVHITKEKMSLHTRVHIVRQIAQGMGYLHAKGVVMSKLNSKNIYLEPKVKLCLVDYSMAEKKYERTEYGYVPKGHLTYVAPELLRTLTVIAPKLIPKASYTAETDVFAFGTVMFELMTGQFPFRRMATEVLIWQVGRGFRQSLKHLKYSASLKSVIAQCWAHEPSDRPTLSDINKHFQYNGALHKRHSSSEPERLNTSGLTSKKTIL